MSDEGPAAEQWGMRWEAVPDEADDGERPPDDPSRRRRVRALVAACAAGAVVIVVLLVVGIRVLVHDLDERTGNGSAGTLHEHYQRQFAQCVGRGMPTARCADTAARACLADRRWRGASDAAIARGCAIKTRGR